MNYYSTISGYYYFKGSNIDVYSTNGRITTIEKESEQGKRIERHIQNLMKIEEKKTKYNISATRCLALGLTALISMVVLLFIVIFQGRVWDSNVIEGLLYSVAGLTIPSILSLYLHKRNSKKADALRLIAYDLDRSFTFDQYYLAYALNQITNGKEYNALSSQEREDIQREVTWTEPCSTEQGVCLSPRHKKKF